MGKWRKVVQCNECGKIYPNGIGYICTKCGTTIGRDSLFLNELFGYQRLMLVNAKKVIARRRWFKGWEVKE